MAAEGWMHELVAGTSDEHISVVQYLKTSQVDGAVIVTTPQEVSIIDVRKEINFCKKVTITLLPCSHASNAC